MPTLVLDDIRDAIAAVRPIIAGADAEWKTYHLIDGQLRAKSRIMRAGIPIMYDEELIVPVAEFEKLIKTIRKNPEVIIGKNQLLFKIDKMRVSMPRLSVEKDESVKELDGEVIELTSDFLENLKTLSILIEDAESPDWQNSIICVNGMMICTHRGQLMMFAEYEPFKENDIKCLLPHPLVKFLLNKKTAPEEMILTESQVQFNWPDDSWVISSLITGKVPARLFKLLDSCKDVDWILPDEHREVLKDVEALGADGVYFNAEGTWASLETGKIELDVIFPLGTEKESSWSVKHLSTAMSVADRFDFTKYPEPCVFAGDRVRGLMAGKIV